jgi:micrococcal nuclease
VIAADARDAGDDTSLKRPTDPSYVYGATLDQVIDGDTVDLRIDLGFHVDRRGRFRLAAIDCPELPSADARAAHDFVFNQLGTAKTIVVKTQRTDLHGRYVTHLFYSHAEVPIDTCFLEGTYLNGELLDADHAVLAVT